MTIRIVAANRPRRSSPSQAGALGEVWGMTGEGFIFGGRGGDNADMSMVETIVFMLCIRQLGAISSWLPYLPDCAANLQVHLRSAYILIRYGVIGCF